MQGFMCPPFIMRWICDREMIHLLILPAHLLFSLSDVLDKGVLLKHWFCLCLSCIILSSCRLLLQFLPFPVCLCFVQKAKPCTYHSIKTSINVVNITLTCFQGNFMLLFIMVSSVFQALQLFAGHTYSYTAKNIKKANKTKGNEHTKMQNLPCHNTIGPCVCLHTVHTALQNFRGSPANW